MSQFTMEALLVTILIFLPIVRSDDIVIPADKAQVNAWFDAQLSSAAALAGSAEAVEGGQPKVITVKAGGGGDFTTVTDAIKSIPSGNTQRVIVSIGPGNYTEKITIDKTKPFITLYGDPTNMPVLVYGGTAAQYGTVFSGTLTVDADHFSAVNLIIVNSAPRPDGKMKLAQAVALRAGGDFQSYYNVKLHGYQDTLCDIKGKHLFKDCYIEGTVDFIFGSGQSLYVNSEIHVIPGEPMALITAQARNDPNDPTGFMFLHCSVTGTGNTAYLGRSWFPYPRVVFAYSDLSDVVHPEGWSTNFHPETASTVFFGEYNNVGAGADFSKRAPFAKQLTDADLKKYASLQFIEGTTWLKPPTKL